MTREEIILALLILIGISICITFGFLMELIRQNIKRIKLTTAEEELNRVFTIIDNLLITIVESHLHQFGEDGLDYDDIIFEFEEGIGQGGIGTLKYIFADYTTWLENRISQILNK